MSFAAIESKIEDMAHTMLDHAEVTKGLKEKLLEGEAALAGAVRSVEEKLTSAKDEIMTEVRSMLDGLKSEILGDFDKVKTDTVEKAKEAVAALKSDEAASVSEPAPTAPAEPAEPLPASEPVETAPAAEEAPAAPAAPVVATTPSGAMTVVVPSDATEIHTEPGSGILTMPGTVSHVDEAGTHTTVPLDGTPATAVDAAGTPVEPAQAAVAEARNAAAEAGINITN